jgi:hypothetical protein
MPTGSKLAGGVIFFAIAYMAALQAKLTFEEGTQATYFAWVISGIGFWQGWLVMGNRAGAGMRPAIANGMRTALQIAFFGLGFFALRTMFIRSADLRYSAPGEAVVASLELFIDYATQSATIGVWGVLMVGGMLGGMAVEIASRMWR